MISKSIRSSFSGLLIAATIGCALSVQADTKTSKAYLEVARKLYAYEKALGKEVRAIAAASCEECDLENDVDVMTYDDVLRLLQFAIESDRSNYHAYLLAAKIRYARSIVGFGDYDPVELGLADQAINKVPPNQLGSDSEKERAALRKAISDAMNKSK